MLIEYTERWKGFQFRSPVFLDGHLDHNLFDLVKWEKYDEPMSVYSVSQEKYIEVTEGCYSVGHLEWDEKERCFEFKSVGMRFLEDYVEGLNEFILDFADEMYKERMYIEE